MQFSTVRPIEPPIHPLAPAKMKCGTCLTTHKVLRNRFLERFYVLKDFFSNIQNRKFSKKVNFFPKNRKFSKMFDFHCFHCFSNFNTKTPSAHPVPSGPESSNIMGIPHQIHIEFDQFPRVRLCLVRHCLVNFRENSFRPASGGNLLTGGRLKSRNSVDIISGWSLVGLLCLIRIKKLFPWLSTTKHMLLLWNNGFPARNTPDPLGCRWNAYL